MVRVVRRVLGTRDGEEEDAVQTALEAWIRLRNSAPVPERQGLQLAAVIARNVAIDLLRQRARAGRVLVPEREGDWAGPGVCPVDPERVVAARELLSGFARALDGLRPTVARALFLHDVLGYELEDVAAELGVSVSAAQSRLVRGRRELASQSWARETPFRGAWRGRRRPARTVE